MIFSNATIQPCNPSGYRACFGKAFVCAILIGSLLSVLQPARVQGQEISYTFYSPEDGLSHFTATTVLDHSDQFLYVGTRDGYNRFDGYHFVSIPSNDILDHSAQAAWIMHQVELQDGHIFLIYSKAEPSTDHEISTALFDPSRGSYTPFPADATRGFQGLIASTVSSDSITYFLGLDEERIYVHTMGEDMGFDLLFSVPHRPEVVPLAYSLHQAGFPHIKRWALVRLRVPDRYLMFDNYNGLRILDSRGNVMRTIPLEPMYKELGLTVRPNLYQDALIKRISNGRIAIQPSLEYYGKGYFFYDEGRDTCILAERYPDPWSSILWYMDDHGNTFRMLSHETTGDVRCEIVLDDGNTVIPADELDGLKTTAQFFGTDISRQMYIATHRGLIKVNVQQPLFKSYLNSDLYKWEYEISGRAIFEWNRDSILLAAEKQGLHLLDRKTGVVTPLRVRDIESGLELDMGYVFQIFRGNDGRVWVISVPTGIVLLDLKRGTGKVYNLIQETSAYSNALLSDGTIFRAGNKLENFHINLHLFDPESEQFDPLVFKNTDRLFKTAIPSYLLQEENSYRVWMGTKSGLFLLDLEARQILCAYLRKETMPENDHPYSVHPVLNASHIMAIHRDSAGSIWLGMENGGLNILDPANHAVRFITAADGLSNNSVCGILADSTGYWLSTFNGVSHYDPGSNEFRNFHATNGLSHNEQNRYSFLRAADGTIFVGGLNGFNSFDPEHLLYYDRPARLVLAEATYFNRNGTESAVQVYGFGEETHFRIPSDNRACSFRFALTDYSNPENNSFSYALAPYPQTGTQNPGWQSLGNRRELNFDFLPAGKYDLQIRAISSNGVPSANTLSLKLDVHEFFYKTPLFIVFVLILVTLGLYSLYRYRLGQAIRLERLRTRISSDLHDDVGGLLSGIAYQMEVLEMQSGEKQRSIIERIKHASREAMFGMRDVIWAIDSGKDTFGDLEERLRKFASEVITDPEIRFTLEASHLASAQRLPSDIRHHLLMILKECITNTLKHACATEMHIAFEKKHKNLLVTYTDDGSGFELRTEYSGMGMANIQARAHKINADLDIRTREGFQMHLVVKAF